MKNITIHKFPIGDDGGGGEGDGWITRKVCFALESDSVALHWSGGAWLCLGRTTATTCKLFVAMSGIAGVRLLPDDCIL